jgi:arylsulfatase A-like enzyme
MPDRPNIVLCISDQQRADTMPGVRRALIRTPHLEWLADRSTLFRRAYCTTPMCSPARSSILTGLYPHATGLVANYQERDISREIGLSPQVPVLADYLKEAGYVCAYTGKWHLGTGGDRRGFIDFNTRAGIHDVDGPEQNDMLQFTRKVGVGIGGKLKGNDIDKNTYDARTRVGTSLLPLAFHRSSRDAGQAGLFIRQMRQREEPFCLVYSCYEPHPPFACPAPFDAMYDPADMPLPENRRETAAYRLMRRRNDRQLQSAKEFDDDDLRRMWAHYCGAVSYVDHCAGLVLEALIDTDQFDDTLFVFTSDHGEMLGSHGMLLKGSVLFEELMRVPLLVRPPGGQESGRQNDCLVSHVDLVPTLLSWCGVESPGELHGVDIRALVEGSDASVRDGLALEFHSSNWGERPTPLRGWRTQRWKYVETIGGDDELYDLDADPDEMRNLIDHTGAQVALEEMRGALRAWVERCGDSWPEVPVPEREVPWESDDRWD